ncbi:methionyl-tRNA synthetase [Lunasporangiospora selenospora]|uniref:Probable methionine--tRNA ligase, mitochondrial n=1 Tax=Lunasporangiospora selenospora TaxID=979761 RepID=A0A9P6FT01_9FUNG|nr:methionyl-tRNA synthetase [Lunasporangiospora selenospora]
MLNTTASFLRCVPLYTRPRTLHSSPAYFPSLAALARRQLGAFQTGLPASYSTFGVSEHAAVSTNKPYYITTPIFYVNAVPHIGHLHSVVLADTLKRFQEMKGRKGLLSTGTDEHGLKASIQQAAAAAEVSEKELCDRVSQRFKALFDAANISYTTFIRTTDMNHAVAVKEMWNDLWNKGYIYKGQHEGWYSVSDEAFYASTQVEEKTDEKTGEKYHVSIETGKAVEWTTEENYKFKLSEFTEPLLNWLDKNPEGKYNEVREWLQQGLSDLSVSRPRSRLTWGIPIPGDDSHVMYVWMDALTNYLTVTGYPWRGIMGAQKATGGWPADAQIVGKDILRFHAVYWPAFLMAAGLELPKKIVAHAHWTQSKMKMSKSIGNVVDPFTAMEEFGTDTIRFYLMNDGGLSDDADYSSELVAGRYRKLLAGQLGNLLSRSTSLALNPSKKVPSPPSEGNIHPDDLALWNKLKELPEKVDQSMTQFRTTQATHHIFDMLAEANANFSHGEPWKLVKDPSNKERVDQLIWNALESTRMAALLLQPIIPTKSSEILDQLGVRGDERSWEHAQRGRGWAADQEARSVATGGPMFPPLKK